MDIQNLLSALFQRINEENEQNDYKISVQRMECRGNNSVELMLMAENAHTLYNIFIKDDIITLSKHLMVNELDTFNDVDSCIEFLITDVKTKYLEKKAEEKVKAINEFEKLINESQSNLDPSVVTNLKNITSSLRDNIATSINPIRKRK